MLSYFQQKLLLEMKKNNNIKQREQTSYKCVGRFYRAMAQLQDVGLVNVKKDRRTNTNTYTLSIDGQSSREAPMNTGSHKVCCSNCVGNTPGRLPIIRINKVKITSENAKTNMFMY